ncbi:MAG: cupredoxin domain-containing protein [Myxococcota bacterium]
MRLTATRLLHLAALALLITACGDDTTSTITPFVKASDQAPEAPYDTVVIDDIAAAEAGWIVVYQDANGGFGRQLGHAAVKSGTSTQVAVTLIRTAVDGETLHALLHVDHGQDGDFEFPGQDEPVLTEGGEPVSGSFVVTVADQTLPDLQVENQTLASADEVAITRIVATAPGRVVIRAQSNNAPADIIGSLNVEEGVTGEDGAPAMVSLSRDAANGELLYAVLQRLVGSDPTSTEDSDYEDEFDLLSNGPLMVLFTVSIETTTPITEDTSTQEDVTVIEDIGPSDDTATADDDVSSTEDAITEDVGPSVEDTEDDDPTDAEDIEEPEDASTVDPEESDTPEGDITEDDTEAPDAAATDADECAPIADCGDLTCGELDDGCGDTLLCGSCDEGEVCTDGTCEATTPAFLCDPTFAGCTEEDFAAHDVTAEDGTIAITMSPFAPYSPMCLRMQVGQTVTVEATADHPFEKVCAEDAIMDTQDGATSLVEFTMTTPGYYNYQCALHPVMVGNIQVVP